MLKTENTNMNMSGTIYTGDNVVLANVNGNFNGGDDFYLNISVPMYSEVAANKATLYADLESFIDQLIANIIDLKD